MSFCSHEENIRMKTRWMTAGLCLALTACASTHNAAQNVSSAAAAHAVAQAQAAVKEASAMTALWSPTAADLKKAEQAQAAGDNAKAISLSQEVIKQTAVSEAQAQSGANAKPSYP